MVTCDLEEFTLLCDAIDAVDRNLARECDDEWRAGFDEGFASADDYFAEHADDLLEHGWVRLPLDADGVPIRVGDVMVYVDGNTCPLPVVALVPPAVFITDEGPRYADMCRHAPDTWERIIKDVANFALDMQHQSGEVSLKPFVARCKALAGDAE